VSEIATNVTFGNSTPATGIQTDQTPAVITVAPTADPNNYLRQFTINLQQGGDSNIFGILTGVLDSDGNQEAISMYLVNPISDSDWNVSAKGAEAPDIPGQSSNTDDTTPPPQDDTVADDTEELAATGTDTAVALTIAFVLSLGALMVVRRKSA
jgi:LPXTG-motif cell wall-anchored protein